MIIVAINGMFAVAKKSYIQFFHTTNDYWLKLKFSVIYLMKSNYWQVQILYLFFLNTYKHYTVGTESIQTPLNFSLFAILQPFAKII